MKITPKRAAGIESEFPPRGWLFSIPVMIAPDTETRNAPKRQKDALFCQGKLAVASSQSLPLLIREKTPPSAHLAA